MSRSLPNELVDHRTTGGPRALPVRRFELSEEVLTWSPGVSLAKQACVSPVQQ